MAAPDRSTPAVAARDAGVRRIRRATRWLLTGAVTLTGVFAGLAAHATKTTSKASAATPPASGASSAGSSSSGAGAAQSGSSDQSGSGESGGSGDGSGYEGGSGYGYGSGGYGYNDPSASTAQAPQQAPQASQTPTPSVSSGAS